MMRLRYFIVLFFFMAGLAPVAAQFQVPNPRGPVNDLARVLSPGMAQRLEDLSVFLHQETGFSMVFLTIGRLPEDVSIEEYAVKVYEKWGIGAKGKDHGALVVAAIHDRRMRIEAGYGAEGYLPDAVCKMIIERSMAPAFRAGNYDAGFAHAAAEIAQRVAKEFNVDLSKAAGAMRRPVRRPLRRTLSPVQTVILLALLLLLMATPFGRQILFFVVLSSLLGGGRRGGGGFGGGFSSGGGFGGFGGGLSGGGGASGSW